MFCYVADYSVDFGFSELWGVFFYHHGICVGSRSKYLQGTVHLLKVKGEKKKGKIGKRPVIGM